MPEPAEAKRCLVHEIIFWAVSPALAPPCHLLLELWSEHGHGGLSVV